MTIRRRIEVCMISAVVLVCCSVNISSAVAATPALDTRKQMRLAEREAKETNKNILVDFSPSWCLSCRRLDIFLDDPQMKRILGKALVVKRFTLGELPNNRTHPNTPGAADLRLQIEGRQGSYPYVAIVSAKGQKVSDSIRSDGGGNVGYPESDREVDWFMQMLRLGAPRLNAGDLKIVDSWLRKRLNK